MAKKKSEAKSAGLLSKFKTAEQIMQEEKEYGVCCPVGPNLDDALGGGIPSGTFFLIRTLEKTGKTVIAMNIVRNALLQGRKVFYFDVENRMKTKKYFILKDFDIKNPLFHYRSSEEGEILSGEEILTDQIKLMKLTENYGAVYVIDSFSKLTPRDVLDAEEVSGKRRDQAAKMQTDWLSQAGNLIRTSGSIVVGIQHLMIDQSAYNPTGAKIYKAKGAGGISYEGDITLESTCKPMDLNGNTTFVEQDLSGLMLKLRIPHNKRRGPVNTRDGVITYIKFGEGIWFAKEMADQLEVFLNEEDSEMRPMLIKSGSWYTFNVPNFESHKVQGKDSVAEIIDENEEFFRNLHKKNMEKTYEANYNFKARS